MGSDFVLYFKKVTCTDFCTSCTCIGKVVGNGVPHVLVGDGFCNDETNNAACNYDGGDCCGSCINTKYCKNCTCFGKIIGNGASNPFIGDGFCNDETNNAFCSYDHGDCCLPNKNSDHCSECTCYHQETCAFGPHPAAYHPLVGNGICNDETNIPECHYDGGDCCQNPELAGNGICNDESNIQECYYDEGDCCLNKYVCPGCSCYCQNFELVGNQFCNNETNNVECNYDGGECCGPDLSCKGHCFLWHICLFTWKISGVTFNTKVIFIP